MKRFLALALALVAASASAQINSRTGVNVKDEGTLQGFARSIDFVGSSVSCAIVSGQGTCTFTAGGISGSDTRVLFFDGANNPAGVADLTFDKTNKRLNIGGATAGAKIGATNGSSTDAVLSLYDNATLVFTVLDGGSVQIRSNILDNGNGSAWAIRYNGTDKLTFGSHVYLSSAVNLLPLSADLGGGSTIGAANNRWTGVYARDLYGSTAIEAVTATKTPTETEANETYTNTGDSDGSTITLPNNPTAGTTYNFGITVAQTQTIVANTGETLMHGTSTCSTSLTSNAIGSTITIVAMTGGSGAVWMTKGASGTWTCT